MDNVHDTMQKRSYRQEEKIRGVKVEMVKSLIIAFIRSFRSSPRNLTWQNFILKASFVFWSFGFSQKSTQYRACSTEQAGSYYVQGQKLGKHSCGKMIGQICNDISGGSFQNDCCFNEVFYFLPSNSRTWLRWIFLTLFLYFWIETWQTAKLATKIHLVFLFCFYHHLFSSYHLHLPTIIHLLFFSYPVLS